MFNFFKKSSKAELSPFMQRQVAKLEAEYLCGTSLKQDFKSYLESTQGASLEGYMFQTNFPSWVKAYLTHHC